MPKLASLLRTAGVVLALCPLAVPAAAQTTSGRPIRMIVPLPAGTATDFAARILAQSMAATLGQPVVVDNRAGANGVIGVQELLRAPADGQTLLVGSQSPLATNAALVKNLPYDPRTSFSPIGGVGQTMHALMVRPDHPARTMPEFIEHAKRNRGKVNVGSSTATNQIQIATLNKVAGLELAPISYKGVPASVADVIGGSLDATFVDLANAMTHAKAGRLRAIAVTSLKRNPLVPDWPAISETLAGYDFPSWVAVVAPAGLPKDQVERLNGAVNKALGEAEFKEKLASIGMTPLVVTPEQLGTLISEDAVNWVRFARDANVEPQ